MTHTLQTLDETISALMDGELEVDSRSDCLEALLADADARLVWRSYHLVGDVLRSDELAAGAADFQFLAKLEARLLPEAAVLAAAAAGDRGQAVAEGQRLHSANASIFRWRMAAGGAFALLMALFAGSFFAPSQSGGGEQMVVSTPAKVIQPGGTDSAATAVVQDGMIRDPRLDQLLSAHQQLGGHSALQMPSGFLRNATYDGKGR